MGLAARQRGVMSGPSCQLLPAACWLRECQATQVHRISCMSQPWLYLRPGSVYSSKCRLPIPTRALQCQHLCDRGALLPLTAGLSNAALHWLLKMFLKSRPAQLQLNTTLPNLRVLRLGPPTDAPLLNEEVGRQCRP